jgi:ubiquinone/menaquinone biosynthesis C-methylase UbiE
MPHLLRWTLAVPRGNLSPSHLARILEPRPGECILEIGPGTGIYSLPVATALAPGGTLDVLDVQLAMLAEVTSRARAAGVTNVAPTHGDARALPYPDRTFDAAYLVGVLGEIPDEAAALRELRRVLRPGGGSSSARSLSIRTSCGSACSSAVPTPPPSRSTESSAGCSPI